MKKSEGIRPPVEVDADDRLRRAVIERLMCDLSVDLSAVGADLGVPSDSFSGELSALAPMARDGLVELEGSRVRITDTGQPLSLDYDFQDGAGTVTVSHGAADSRQNCKGSATSSMENEKLTIEHGAITCPDGSTFERSRVECAVGDGGRADCRGINEDQSTYDVRIGR